MFLLHYVTYIAFVSRKTKQTKTNRCRKLKDGGKFNLTKQPHLEIIKKRDLTA